MEQSFFLDVEGLKTLEDLNPEIVKRLVSMRGRTIDDVHIAVEKIRDMHGVPCNCGSVTLTLDDGNRVEFYLNQGMGSDGPPFYSNEERLLISNKEIINASNCTQM
jgi:hypothetical protein